jgi:hypothetical protein
VRKDKLSKMLINRRLSGGFSLENTRYKKLTWSYPHSPLSLERHATHFTRMKLTLLFLFLFAALFSCTADKSITEVSPALSTDISIGTASGTGSKSGAAGEVISKERAIAVLDTTIKKILVSQGHAADVKVEYLNIAPYSDGKLTFVKFDILVNGTQKGQIFTQTKVVDGKLFPNYLVKNNFNSQVKTIDTLDDGVTFSCSGNCGCQGRYDCTTNTFSCGCDMGNPNGGCSGTVSGSCKP